MGKKLGRKKLQEEKLNVLKLKMLRWSFGVTKVNKINNDRIRGITELSQRV